MKTITGIASLMMVAAWCATAQDPAGQEQKMKAELESSLRNAKVLSVEGGVMGAPVKGSPYAATETTESTQVLGDGTNIHNLNQTTVYRDGMGRIRRESGDEILIMDPVNNVRYALHPKDHTAIKMPMPMAVTMEAGKVMQRSGVMMGAAGGGGPMMMAAPAGVGMVAMAGPAMQVPDAVIMQTFVSDGVNVAYKGVATGGKTEDLGTQSIEGVLAQGTRTTRTIEIGAIGNDRPINMVNERWFSPELQTVVMSKQTDPRMGETVFKLTGIDRGEPDPSLFQVPAGYQVNEPPSPFAPARKE